MRCCGILGPVLCLGGPRFQVLAQNSDAQDAWRGPGEVSLVPWFCPLPSLSRHCTDCREADGRPSGGWHSGRRISAKSLPSLAPRRPGSATVSLLALCAQTLSSGCPSSVSTWRLRPVSHVTPSTSLLPSHVWLRLRATLYQISSN